MPGEVHEIRVVLGGTGPARWWCSARAVPLCFALSMALVGSATSTVLADAAQGPVRSMLEFRQEGTIIQKWDLSCGAAALATILRYQYGDQVSEQEIAKDLIRRDEYIADPSRLQRKGGFSLLDLKNSADRRGYQGIAYGRLTFNRLVDLTPAIVPVNFNGYNHFVVFRGLLGDRVLLADPSFGKRTVTKRRFENAWIDYPQLGRVGFIVARQDGVASSDWLAPSHGDLIFVQDTMLRTILPLSVRP